jgi:hypothetical protein
VSPPADGTLFTGSPPSARESIVINPPLARGLATARRATSEVEDLPEDLERVDVNWDRYLVFPFSLESARVGDLVTAIFAEWFPNHAQGVEPASGDHLQLYKSSPELEALEPGTEIPPTLTMEEEFGFPVR